MMNSMMTPSDFLTITEIMWHYAVIYSFLLQSFGVFPDVLATLICSDQPVIALVGDDVILPCYLDPPTSADAMTVMWTRPGLDPKYIHVHQDGRLLYESQNPSYSYRTRVFVDELIHGNVSMSIFTAKISDEGRYWCSIPSIQKEASIQLAVGSASTPVIEVTSGNRGQMVLRCESAGWYPEPELLWLDGEGNLLSAEATETFRGPDNLYTVSSRVTVQKKHSSKFTCRVQQNNINQSRETGITVADDFTMISSQVKNLLMWMLVFITVAVLFVCWRCS